MPVCIWFLSVRFTVKLSVSSKYFGSQPIIIDNRLGMFIVTRVGYDYCCDLFSHYNVIPHPYLGDTGDFTKSSTKFSSTGAKRLVKTLLCPHLYRESIFVFLPSKALGVEQGL